MSIQIAAGKVKVNPKNHVMRKGAAEDNEDKEVSGALDELDGEKVHFHSMLLTMLARSLGQYVCRSLEINGQRVACQK